MPTVIARYTSDRRPAVREFNRRLSASNGHGEFQFPEGAPPAFPASSGLRAEHFLAVENGDVRGGYILRRQRFSFGGEIREAAHYRLPLSEGLIDRAHAGVAVQMLRSALSESPLLFALGMGGSDQPLPRLLRATGWRLHAVPFYFRVVRPGRFLRGIPALRTSRARRRALDLAALSGAGWVAVQALQFRGARLRGGGELVPEFGGWADGLWDRVRHRYALAAVRDRDALNALYPPADPRFLRLKAGEAGWALLLDTEMRGHKQFGDLRVGTIVDCLAAPEDAGAVIAAAVRELERRGVDLIVSNQCHAAWGAALRRAGFLGGPSNFIFAASKQLAGLLEPWAARTGEIHMNRGDGDGPIHL